MSAAVGQYRCWQRTAQPMQQITWCVAATTLGDPTDGLVLGDPIRTGDGTIHPLRDGIPGGQCLSIVLAEWHQVGRRPATGNTW